MSTPAPLPPRAAQAAEPKPLAGAVLIGTAGTVPAMLTQLASECPANGLPPILGVVLAGPSAFEGPPSQAHWPWPVSVGSLEDLRRMLPRPRVAVVCIPASMPLVAARVSQVLAELGVEERAVPPLADALAPSPDASGWWRPARPHLDPARLIGRRPHTLDRDSVARVLRGKRVLITGAGGSIGSELARIVAGFDPALLVCMERAENALFEIDRRLARTGVARRAVLHDVVDEPATRRLLEDLRPDVVFHAAAHKHVPLMEDHPAHAVTNNVFGTLSVARAAAETGCAHFVLISTDKAVHPTSVMGATKRLAEQTVRHLHAEARAAGSPATAFAVVRFGNVLGSACSVLPIWAAQLAEGTPITITDPRMTRYFMTIPEAATLVIQAAALCAEAGHPPDAPLFVLDMGEPVRIVDLAERLIRSHGLTPVFRRPGEPAGVGPGQAEVVFTGIRPGEKLHEALTYDAEPLRPTRHPGIRTIDTRPDPLPDVEAILERLDHARHDPDPAGLLETLREAVPDLAGDPVRQAG
jgi:FlaA1/EpsC-like NDP-sugar epimerase